MIKKRNRKELYDKFRQGAIPSGADFADFIRSQVNLLDDGLDISDDPDQPINIRAKGDEENLLDFSNPENAKRWRLSNRSEDEAREGLNIKAESRSHLFVERGTGNIGVDTDKPQAKLHLKQIGGEDAVRIDDDGTDSSPFVITSEGKVGIGVGGETSPDALLHVKTSGVGDTMRVDDANTSKTHLVINESGNAALGFSHPSDKAKLAVNGAVTVGSNQVFPGDNGLYVAGNVTIDGNINFTKGDNKGDINITGNLKSDDDDVIIRDDVYIKAETDQLQGPSNGNLYVDGNTTLGSYDQGNIVRINGVIRSGEDYTGTLPYAQQEDLLINDVLNVNRNVDANKVTSKAPLQVDKNLTVKGNTILGTDQTNSVILNGKVRSNAGDLVVDDNLTVNHQFQFGPTGHYTNSIVNVIDGKDSRAMPTEKAVKEYVDNEVDALEERTHRFFVDRRTVANIYRGVEKRKHRRWKSGSWGSGHYVTYYTYHHWWDPFVDLHFQPGHSKGNLLSYAIVPYQSFVNWVIEVWDDRIRAWDNQRSGNRGYRSTKFDFNALFRY